MSRFYLLVIILLLFISWVRIDKYRHWVEEDICDTCTLLGTVRLTQNPLVTDFRSRFDWRGIRVECPSTLKECATVAELQAGDKVAFHGTSTWEDKGNLWPVVTVTIEAVDRVERINPRPFVSWWWWVRQASHFQAAIIQIYRSYFSEPYAGLLSGIVLGVGSALPADFYDALIKTGTLHVVAASGYNISVVAGVLIGILVFILPRRQALWGSIGGVVLYVLLAGGSPAVVRAGIMGSLAFLAQTLGKESTARWSLFVSAIIMVLVSPWMMANVSFQLSVAATAGIMFGVPYLERRLRQHQIKLLDQTQLKSLVKDLTTTLAATLATLPITLVVFGRVSWLAPVVNILILWLVPPIMAMGAVVGISGLFLPWLGQLAALVTYPLLRLFVVVVELFASIPGVMVELEGVGWWFALGWWLIMLGLMRTHQAKSV